MANYSIWMLSYPIRTFDGIIIEKYRNETLKFLRDGKYFKSSDEINNIYKRIFY